ncbi:MAG TPA: hypothetical protein VIM85_08835 [Pseudomonadales bacterium]
MDKTKRLRRVGILCCHFARNYAYYKAGWNNGDLKVKDQFWVSLNSNFIDIAVLEWYKLFGDYKDKHHWKKVMHDDQCFKTRMFEELGIKQADLDKIHGSVKSYRDKFVAHLDSEETMNIPRLEDALRMVYFYYSEVQKICDSTADWPKNLEDFYKEHFEKAKDQYESKT